MFYISCGFIMTLDKQTGEIDTNIALNHSTTNFHLKDTISSYCLSIIKQDDFKHEFKKLLKPMVSMIIKEITPYIVIAIVLVFLSFLLMVAIIIFIANNHQYLNNFLYWINLKRQYPNTV